MSIWIISCIYVIQSTHIFFLPQHRDSLQALHQAASCQQSKSATNSYEQQAATSASSLQQQATTPLFIYGTAKLRPSTQLINGAHVQVFTSEQTHVSHKNIEQ